MVTESGDVFEQVARLAKVPPEHFESFRRGLRSIVGEHAQHGGDAREKALPIYRADILKPLEAIATSARELRRRLNGLDYYEGDAQPWATFLQARLASQAGLDDRGIKQLLVVMEILGRADEAAKGFKTARPSKNASLVMLVKQLLLAAETHGGKLSFSAPDGVVGGPLVKALKLLRPILSPALFPDGERGKDFFERAEARKLLGEARRGLNRPPKSRL